MIVPDWIAIPPVVVAKLRVPPMMLIPVVMMPNGMGTRTGMRARMRTRMRTVMRVVTFLATLLLLAFLTTCIVARFIASGVVGLMTDRAAAPAA
jgi:hypothetical protein